MPKKVFDGNLCISNPIMNVFNSFVSIRQATIRYSAESNQTHNSHSLEDLMRLELFSIIQKEVRKRSSPEKVVEIHDLIIALDIECL